MPFNLGSVMSQDIVDTAIAGITCPVEHKGVLEYQAKNLLTELIKADIDGYDLAEESAG